MVTLHIIVKLICAHLCADFLFQTDVINEGKRKSGVTGFGFQLLHSSIHAIISYLFVAEWSCWLIPFVIFVTHLMIDLIKCKFGESSFRIFIIDQLSHLVVILVLWFSLFVRGTELSSLGVFCTTKLWVVIMSYILMLKPSSVLLGLFLNKWTPTSTNTQSLPNAGQWIGYLERMLILTFVFTGSMEGVGFLLAAKSVFRFGELNKAKEIRTTEYVLIGTLASFTIAILTGMAVKKIIGCGLVV